VQDSVLEQQTPAQVSSILWALGVIHNHATAQVAASSSTGQQDQHAAARQIRHQCLTLAHAMLQHTTALLATSSSTWRSDQLASMLWGLAQLGVQIGHKWMSQYFSASAALLRQGLYTPKALAIELTSMAKVHKHSVQVREEPEGYGLTVVLAQLPAALVIVVAISGGVLMVYHLATCCACTGHRLISCLAGCTASSNGHTWLLAQRCTAITCQHHVGGGPAGYHTA
jgi:hypothetical protein